MPVATYDTPIWRVTERDRASEVVLQDALGVPNMVAAVLVNRGYTDPAVAQKFLNPSLDDLYSPALLPDYDQAVASILKAKELGQTIYVHGDYDVDGVSSTALFTRFLQKIGCAVVPHVPHRTKEGYGIHIEAIQWAKDHGADLFSHLRLRISAHDQVIAATTAGMRVVVTDHHQVGDSLPEAEAVVNPHRSDSVYPWPELAGVGVVFKLCAGLTKELGHKVEQFHRAYLDLAVLGTVADVMPLLDENRIITKFGLERLKETNKAGLQALLRVSDLTKQSRLTARNVGFQIGPRINAVGRIEDASTALDLLLTNDFDEAKRLAELMDVVNNERRAEQLRSVEEAIAMVEETGVHDKFTLVLAEPSWHPGLVGLIAGRLVEKFRRPSFVLTVVDGVAKGSARSIPGFDLGDAIRQLKPIIEGGGGHAMAAGFSVKVERIDEFRTTMEGLAQATLKPEDLRPIVEVDAELLASEAGEDNYYDLCRLEPYGSGNREPTFAVRGVEIAQVVPTSNPDHARVTFKTDSGLKSGMAFKIGRQVAAFKKRSKVDVAFTLEENTFNGSTTVRWTVLSVQEAES